MRRRGAVATIHPSKPCVKQTPPAMHEEPIFTTARILEPINQRAFHAELPNGKPVVAHLPKRHARLAPAIRPGARVRVALTPFDFDKARIESIETTPNPSPPPGK